MTVVSVNDHGNTYILAWQIANSSTFQAVVGEANQTDAFTHIFYPYDDFDGLNETAADQDPPRCIISDELGSEEYSGGWNTWQLAQSWWVTFDFPVPAAYSQGDDGSTRNSWAWFQLQVRNVIKEIRAMGRSGSIAGGVSYMDILSANRMDGPYRLDAAELVPDTPDGTDPLEVWHVAYEISRGY